MAGRREKKQPSFVKHNSEAEEYHSFDRSQEEDTLFEHYTLHVTNGQKAIRVDKFLTNQLPQTSRSKIQNAAITGSISVNDQRVKVSYKVKPGDTVKLMLPFPPVPVIEAEEMDLNILHENDAFLIVYKPPSMVVHPAIGNRTGTLVQGLMWYFDNLPDGTGSKEFPRPGLVHRIDKETTGILVIAKTEFAMAHLSKQFFDRSTDRRYIALAWGDIQDDEGTVIAAIGRNQKNRKIFQAYPNNEVGKHAITHYKVLERFGIATLVECKLETGRTHQIRVHMKHIGHPLMGDYEYGGDRIVAGPNHKKYQQMMTNCLGLFPGQALHAKTLTLDHPTTGERMAFDSDLPPHFEEVLAKLRRWRDATLTQAGA